MSMLSSSSHRLVHIGPIVSSTMLMNIAQIVLAFRLPGYTNMLSLPVMALENVMSCRVHRAIILGLIADHEQRSAPFALSTIIARDEEMVSEHGLDTKS